MKKVIVKNKDGVMIAGSSEYADPTQWIADCIASNAWGKPERWVLHKDEPMAEAYDEADVLEERTVEDVPAVPPQLLSEAIPTVPAELDENGNVIKEEIPEVPAVYSEEIPAKTHKEVKLRAEYTIEIIDITNQVMQDKINAESLAYLASTDWLIIREMDAGIPCPSEIKAERAAARAKIVR